jgi:hypothetical protein
MVDELGFTRSSWNFCQAFFPGKHIDQWRLPNITSAYEGELRVFGFRALFIPRTTDHIWSRNYIHTCNLTLYAEPLSFRLILTFALLYEFASAWSYNSAQPIRWDKKRKGAGNV